jgi:anaerobic dimethyl sulfoxide reductase subunit C (anchor subunit)/Tat-targeted selenate reductase subunit YnfH
MNRAAADRLFAPYNAQSAEWPLVLFTLTAQAVVGALVHQLLSGAQPGFATQATLLAVFLVAQLFSVFHLGNKLNAYRSVWGLGHSWLSAEIAALGLLTAVMAGMTLLAFLRGAAPGLLRLGLGVEAVVGLVFLACMINIYRLPARPLWNTLLTPVSFLASANLLGLSLHLALTGGAYSRTDALNVALTLLVLLAVQAATLRRFGFWPALLRAAGGWSDVRTLYVLRLGLAALTLLLLLAGAPLAPVFALVAAGEILGRALFFKLCPATRNFGALHV